MGAFETVPQGLSAPDKLAPSRLALSMVPAILAFPKLA